VRVSIFFKQNLEGLTRCSMRSKGNIDVAEIAQIFPDCQVGAMPPFGSEYGLETYVDEHLAADPEILIPAGTHEDSVLLAWKDFERLAQAKVAAFASHAG
jgi:Ala-tRNA(Pro) deacylase